MRKVGMLLALSLFLGTVVSAQGLSLPKAEVFIGYQYGHMTYSDANLFGGGFAVGGYNTPYGFSGQFVYYPTSWVGIVGDIGFAFPRTIAGGTASGQLRTYMAGPKVGFEHGPLHPYVQFLIGDAQLSQGLWNTYNNVEGNFDGLSGPASTSGQASYNGYAFSFGGGIDARIAHRVYLRLGEIDYLATHFESPSAFGTRFRQNNFQYKAGIVFRF